MAWESPGFCIGALTASASLATKQYFCVKAHTSNNKVALCSVDGEVVLGVVQENPVADEAAEVMVMGVSKVVAGGTLVAGDSWGTDSSGKAVKKTLTGSAADTGDYVVGKVLEGASTNEFATVTIGIAGGFVI